MQNEPVIEVKCRLNGKNHSKNDQPADLIRVKDLVKYFPFMLAFKAADWPKPSMRVYVTAERPWVSLVSPAAGSLPSVGRSTPDGMTSGMVS
jgi:hypothetical protein